MTIVLWSSFLSASILLLACYTVYCSLAYKRNLNCIDVTLSPSAYRYEYVSFKSAKDDIPLKGVFFISQAPLSRTLVLVHGFNENRMMGERTEMLVRYFLPRGYNILAFDLRGQGKSGGRVISFGCYERFDVIGAIDYIKERMGEGERICVLGFSMGAVTAIDTAAADRRVEAVIADSPFKDLKQFLINDANTVLSGLKLSCKSPFSPFCLSMLCHIPINKVTLKLGEKISNVKLNEVSPASCVRSMQGKHILLIHGKEDMIIPYANSLEIYSCIKSNPGAELWITEKAGHVESLMKYPEEYFKKVCEFLDNCMA